MGKRGPIHSKMQLILLLALSLIGQTYLSTPMLYTMVLCLTCKQVNSKTSNTYENSLLYTT